MPHDDSTAANRISGEFTFEGEVLRRLGSLEKGVTAILVANGDNSKAILPNLAAAVAQLIIDLKAFGYLGT